MIHTAIIALNNDVFHSILSLNMASIIKFPIKNAMVKPRMTIKHLLKFLYFCIVSINLLLISCKNTTFIFNYQNLVRKTYKLTVK